MLSRTFCLRTRPRTRDPRTRTWSRGQGRGLETKFKTRAKKPITSKRPYHNDTLLSTAVTLVRFCTYWKSLVASYYWSCPTMQKISDKPKNWHLVTLAIADPVSLIFVTNFLLCCIYVQLQSCRPWDEIGPVILLTTMLSWFRQFLKIMVSA